MNAETITVRCPDGCARCSCQRAERMCLTCVHCEYCAGQGTYEVPAAEVFDAPALWDRVAAGELLELLRWAEDNGEDATEIRKLEGACVVRGGLRREPKGGFLVGGVFYPRVREAIQAMQTRRVA